MITDTPLTILVPVFNDWEAAEFLLLGLDEACGAAGLRPSVLLVNDGSSTAMPVGFAQRPYSALAKVEVLGLYSNLGHQRAICTGLVHLASVGIEGPVVVMDGDGEDNPEHVPLMLARLSEAGGGTAVFAARARRAEGPVFRFFYRLYRVAHRLLVGTDVRIGNFSVLPMRTVHRLIRSTELWNHYAAAVVGSRCPMTTMLLDRSKRLTGDSRMSFASLVIHGLSAMAVFGHTVAVRLLMATMGLAAFAVFGVVLVVTLRFGSDLAVPGWATTAAGLLAVLLIQALLAATVFSLSLVAGRSMQTVIPVRDCPIFIEAVHRVWPP